MARSQSNTAIPSASAARDSDIDFDPQSEKLDAAYAAFHKRAKALPAAERDAIEAKFAAAFAARKVSDQRRLNDMYLFWKVCPQKACRRVARCAGEPQACFEQWWPFVPEREKILFRSFITRSVAGLSDADAWNAALAEAERCAEHIARTDAETAARWEAANAARAAAKRPHTAR